MRLEVAEASSPFTCYGSQRTHLLGKCGREFFARHYHRLSAKAFSVGIRRMGAYEDTARVSSLHCRCHTGLVARMATTGDVATTDDVKDGTVERPTVTSGQFTNIGIQADSPLHDQTPNARRTRRRPSPTVISITSPPSTFATGPFTLSPSNDRRFIATSRKTATMGSRIPFATCATRIKLMGLYPISATNVPIARIASATALKSGPLRGLRAISLRA